MAVRLSPAQAAALGLVDRRAPRTTRRTAPGPYRSRCVCGEVFETRAAENRHVGPGHNRFDTLSAGAQPAETGGDGGAESPSPPSGGASS